MFFIGLCNYGDKYKNTVHNVGGDWFWFGVSKGYIVNTKELATLVMGTSPDKKHTFVIIKGYINHSGSNLKSALAAMQIQLEPKNICIVYDDVNIELTQLKCSQGMGNSGHNGIKNLKANFGNEPMRVRIGVGRPGPNTTMNDYVLSTLSTAQIKAIASIYEIIFKHLDDISKCNVGAVYGDLVLLNLSI